jgi:phosphatidylglycerol---prolipoprotein diacylglyceryl transferase
MHPQLFTVPGLPLPPNIPGFLAWLRGPFTLHTYGLLLAVAFLVGLWVASRQAKRAGLDSNRVTDMAVWVLIAGLVGAKLMLVVVDWRHYSADWSQVWSLFQSGGVFYGGLLGGMLMAWWHARRYSLPAWPTADVLAPGVVIGQAIGRIGCFFAGCCYGKPATVPWAVTFTDAYANRHVGTPVDIPLHPSQLYESLACFLIFFFLLWLAPRKRFAGQVVLTYAILYSVARFALEFFRGDPERGGAYGLSTSQIVAVVIVLGATYLYTRLRRPPLAAPAPA